jgi:bisanhydrobacterioruberin hydratase
MMNKYPKTTFYILLFIIIYTLGGIGFLLPLFRPVLTQFTPFILLLTFIIVLTFHEKWEKKHIIIFILSYSICFLVEMIGVNTGQIFGSYQYGNGLGLKVLGTPLIIGINWVMLSYCSTTVSQRWFKNPFIQIFSSSLFLLGYDLIMETVAPFMDMWQFNNLNVPIQNYVVWFLLALVINSFMILFKVIGNYQISKSILIIQILFFGIISMFMNFIL